jgi:hypothetical protein
MDLLEEGRYEEHVPVSYQEELDRMLNREGPGSGGAGALDREWRDEWIDRLKEIYSGVSSFRRLEVKGLEEIVAAFVVAIRREANVQRRAPVDPAGRGSRRR